MRMADDLESIHNTPVSNQPRMGGGYGENYSTHLEDRCHCSENDINNNKIPDPVLNLVQLAEKKAELSRTLADLEREIYASEG